MWRPRNSLSLHYMQSDTIHHYTHMRFQVPPRTWAGAASESIDASNDLIIVCRPSASAAWTTFPRVESIGALYEYDPPNHTLQWPYIASVTLGGPTALLHRFPRLRVLYILVNPQDTIERMVGPPQFTECMTDYHWAYTQTVDKIPPKKFHARQRIYYELPKAITKTMCRGLERAIHEVREASIQMRLDTELPPLVIRVMTWKDARGVRGRFDLG